MALAAEAGVCCPRRTPMRRLFTSPNHGYVQAMASDANEERRELADESEKKRLTPGVGAVAAASFFSDSGHEITTSVLPTFLTGTLGASAAALGVIDGISDALIGVMKLVGGPLANDPGKRGRISSGGYLSHSVGDRSDWRGRDGVAGRSIARSCVVVSWRAVAGARRTVGVAEPGVRSRAGIRAGTSGRQPGRGAGPFTRRRTGGLAGCPASALPRGHPRPVRRGGDHRRRPRVPSADPFRRRTFAPAV